MARSVPVIFLAIPILAVAAACGKSGEFRHAAHVTVTKGECAPCHGSDPAAPRPAVDADCAAFHRQAQDPSPSGAGRYGVGKGPPAAARPPGSGGVKFPHAAHAAARIPCAECHAATRWHGNRFVPPTSEECETCHSRTPRKGAHVISKCGPEKQVRRVGLQKNIELIFVLKKASVSRFRFEDGAFQPTGLPVCPAAKSTRRKS